MNPVDKIKRFFRNLAFPNMMAYIVATMAIIYVGDLASGYQISPFMSFIRTNILHGEIWRVLTFLGLPVGSSPLWFVVSLMFYYGIGRDLESAWGSHDFTIYMLTGFLLTITGGFISGAAFNSFLYLSMFMAYAALMPGNTFMLFFVFPVKAKWLAILDAVYMLFSLIFGSFSVRLAAAAALGTFLIFFGKSFFRRIMNKWKHRDFIHQARRNSIKVNKNK